MFKEAAKTWVEGDSMQTTTNGFSRLLVAVTADRVTIITMFHVLAFRFWESVQSGHLHMYNENYRNRDTIA